ncbi:LpqN/LpqT family lipoprotein [Mycolicibacterium stellerae]|uniref:LpqN/LpqT family lipoprotein n=1 Tax=Mycolicibacterium stellerae TaxID=2358193 RepID=UPI000F0BA409|nr:LpqN/LpqT family lipoprotein [Mycolicibacterium stellerae]
MTMAARAVAVVLGAATIVLATACTRVVDDARVVAAPDMGKAAATASDCTKVDAPMTSIPDHTDEEPVLKIPQPEGWERVTMMDSELIRFTMRNEALAKDGFAPTAVVTLESHPGMAEPREVFDAQQDALESAIGATNVSVSETTVCELPAETIDYTTPQIGMLPPHPASVLTAVMHTEDDTYAMTMTVQSADPDNAVFQRDAETILTGFQMLPPSDA